MQQQLVLFLRPAEMLVFNTLFDNASQLSKTMPGKFIVLTPKAVEKLFHEIADAEKDIKPESFFHNVVEALVRCGLLLKADDKTKDAPAGVFQLLVEKSQINGPDYIVEKGVFRLVISFKRVFRIFHAGAEDKASAVPPVEKPAVDVGTELNSVRSLSAPAMQDIVARLEKLERFVEEQQKEIEDMGQTVKQCVDAIRFQNVGTPPMAGSASETVGTGRDLSMSKIAGTEYHSVPALDKITKMPEFNKVLSHIEQILVLFVLSPFAKEWATSGEFVRFAEKYISHRFRLLLIGTVSIYIKKHQELFEWKLLSDSERKRRGVRSNAKLLFRLLPAGEARALRVLELFGVKRDERDEQICHAGLSAEGGSASGGDPASTSNRFRVPPSPRLLRAGKPGMTDKQDKIVGTGCDLFLASAPDERIKRIIQSPYFQVLPFMQRLLIYIGLSPFYDNWFVQYELQNFIARCDGVCPSPKERHLINSLLVNDIKKSGSLFLRKEIPDDERIRWKHSSRLRFQYKLSPAGEKRVKELLTKFE